jgi:GTP pyrophosphokinase
MSLARALDFAVHCHAGQTLKASGASYASHVMRVSALVMEQGGTEAEAIAALLHEATDAGDPTVRAAIARDFGDTVLSWIDAAAGVGVAERPSWRENKEAFLAFVIAQAVEVRRLVAADELEHARAVRVGAQREGAAFWQRFGRSRDDLAWGYAAAASALASTTPDLAAAILSEVAAFSR